ncbi:glycosyltransferase family 39 protein [Ruegeria arenilitoris]|uniref:glycosyltransferase family 39 protein n=1 Tax=Ruegeria arenilitoris TaxID=1173585 RepID=UPI0020C4055E|nr:glycosyltransferase family 39 protein [Ruegeria arenilitoris]
MRSTKAALQRISFDSNALFWCALIIVATSLRLFHLGSESLWNDELASWAFSKVDSLGQVIELTKRDVHPPVYQVFLYFWIKLAGDTEIALRLPAAIAGVWAVAFLLLLGRRLYTPQVAGLSALLLAVSWTPIYYSQEGRAYSLLMLGAIATSYYWVKVFFETRYCGQKVRPYDVVCLAVWSVAMVYLHYFGVLLVGIQVLGAFFIGWRHRELQLSAFALSLVVLISFAPWVPVMLSHSGKEMSHLAAPNSWAALQDFMKFAFDRTNAFSVIPVLAILSFPVLLWTQKTPEGPEVSGFVANYRDLLLVLWFVLPFLMALVISHLITPVWHKRNLIIVVPPIYLMVAASIWSLPKRSVTTVLSVLVLLSAFYSVGFKGRYYSKTKKTQFREAIEFVCERYKREPVLFYALEARYLEYYDDECDLAEKLVGPFGSAGDVQNVKQLLSEMDVERFWYISAHRKPNPVFLQYLSDNFDEIEAKEHRGTRSILMQRRKSMGVSAISSGDQNGFGFSN